MNPRQTLEGQGKNAAPMAPVFDVDRLAWVIDVDSAVSIWRSG